MQPPEVSRCWAARQRVTKPLLGLECGESEGPPWLGAGRGRGGLGASGRGEGCVVTEASFVLFGPENRTSMAQEGGKAPPDGISTGMTAALPGYRGSWARLLPHSSFSLFPFSLLRSVHFPFPKRSLALQPSALGKMELKSKSCAKCVKRVFSCERRGGLCPLEL